MAKHGLKMLKNGQSVGYWPTKCCPLNRTLTYTPSISSSAWEGLWAESLASQLQVGGWLTLA